MTVSPEHQQQAQTALRQGHYTEAVQLFRQLVEQQPTEKSHYWYLGVALLLQGEEMEAQTTWMLAAMEGEKDQIAQWTAELAEVLRSQAEHLEATDNLSQAWLLRQHLRELLPADLENLLHLIALCRSPESLTSGMLDDWALLPLLEHASVALEPTLLQRALYALVRYAPPDELTQSIVQAWLQRYAHADLLPTFIRATQALAGTERQPQAALQYLQLVLGLFPDQPSILIQMVFLYQQLHDYEASIQMAHRIAELAHTLPDQVYANYLQLRSHLMAGGHWDAITQTVAQQEQLITELTKPDAPLLDRPTALNLLGATYALPYIRDTLAPNRKTQNQLMRLLHDSVRHYARDRAQQYQQGWQTRPPRSGPLRIGYLSKCLKHHSVGWLSRWLITHHNREQFQLYGYLWDIMTDEMDDLQHWFISQFDHAYTFQRNSLEIAERIFKDEIDILVDLDSLTSELGFQVLSLKPAPIQVTWLGWDALGNPAIDYFLVDPQVVPDWADEHYVEQLWRLPQTYLAVDGFEVGVPTLRRADLGIPEDAIVYWSGQTSYKQNPLGVRSQFRIVQAVPNSYFLIKGAEGKPQLQQYFLEMAAEMGIEPERLRFLPYIRHEDVHRANLGIADVVLDTYPYNGATTTLEALWLGLPLVTRVGQHFSSRNSYTLLTNAGITEGIAWSEDEYVEWGIRYGTDAELREKVAWKLQRSRQTAPLWNAKAFTREVERAYQQMWSIYMQHQTVNPDHRSSSIATSTPSTMTPLNLHIGGQEPHPEWKILDIELRPEVDFVTDAADLGQFADNSVDCIYASHVLEHFYYGINNELLTVLREWYRVLKPGGQIMISVPDLRTLCWLYLQPDLSVDNRYHIMRMMFGGQTNIYDVHKVGLDAEVLGIFLRDVGFEQYQQVDEFGLFSDCSSLRFGDTLISLNITAQKPVSQV